MRLTEHREKFLLRGETVTVDLNYNNGGNPSSIGYLDYVSVAATRQLSITDKQLAFQYKQAANSSGIGEYQITNTSQISEVWDVTNKGSISAKLNENNASTLSFKATLGSARKLCRCSYFRLLYTCKNK